MKIEAVDKWSVKLDKYNSDLNLTIDTLGYSAQPLTNAGFAFMWAGARATHGAKRGNLCFEVKILDHIDVSHLPVDEPNSHVVRVGFSVNPAPLQLGEAYLSYGYDGTGNIVTKSQFREFGSSFQAGDIILAVVEMNADVVRIGFAKNGTFLGWAYRINQRYLKGRALFPHVLTKNVSLEINFGQKEVSYFPLPAIFKGYTFISCIPANQRVAGSRPPNSLKDCEVIVMCGLPCAGKTTWAVKHSRTLPSKKYNILGLKSVLDKMKIKGIPRKMNYSGNWDQMTKMAQTCLNRMIDNAPKLMRNYILDQTNVYSSSRQIKMGLFEGFQFKAVVILPSEVEYKNRCDKQHAKESEQVDDKIFMEMKANFKLPELEDGFNEVTFVELPKEEAQQLVAKYNAEGKADLKKLTCSKGPPLKKFKPNDPEYGRESLGSAQGNLSRSLDPRRQFASFALGRNPRRDFKEEEEDDTKSTFPDPSLWSSEEFQAVFNPLPTTDEARAGRRARIASSGLEPMGSGFPPSFGYGTRRKLWGSPLGSTGDSASTLNTLQDPASTTVTRQEPASSAVTLQDTPSIEDTLQDMQSWSEHSDGEFPKDSSCHELPKDDSK